MLSGRENDLSLHVQAPLRQGFSVVFILSFPPTCIVVSGPHSVQQSFPEKTGLFSGLTSDDDMIQHFDTHEFAAFDQSLGNGNIRLARLTVSGRMIVNTDKGCRIGQAVSLEPAAPFTDAVSV